MEREWYLSAQVKKDLRTPDGIRVYPALPFLRELSGGACTRPLTKRICICNYICVYRLRFAKSVIGDLKRLRAYDRQRIMEAIEKQLLEEPTRPTRNRKLLVNLIPPWTKELPVWKLRVGDYRVFYDVSQEDETVYVRAVKKKPPGKSTEEIL